MAKKGKGLSPAEFAIFQENEAFWQGNYLTYVKSLTSQKDQELAQVRRRFQSSFRTIAPDHYVFTFAFTNPEEVLAQIPETLVVEIEVGEDFPRALRRVGIVEREVDPGTKAALERGLALKCEELGSFWRVIRLMDSHIGEIYQLGVASLQSPALSLAAETDPEDTTSNSAPIPEEFKTNEPIPDNASEAFQAALSVLDPSNAEQKQRLSRAPVHRYRAATQFVMLKNVGSAACLGAILAVNCARCKRLEEVKLAADGSEAFAGQIECGNCHQSLYLDFHPLILHEKNTTNLGEIQSQGCSPLRVLYFAYKVSCFSCSTDIPTGFSGILEKLSANCPQCEAKFAFSIGQVEFLSGTEEPLEKGQKRSKPRTQLIVGQPLPQNGICKHYKHSYRWFRFRCCQNVFPCDKCHEEQTEVHEYDRADFMVCGYCSAEQKIGSLVTCVKCRQSLTQEASADKKFWEGGKGCRNPKQMSKNEKRKYRK